MKKDLPTLSVVTITYNDPVGLTRTLDSLHDLYLDSHGRMEVLVQNGLSTADLSLVEQSHGWVQFVTAADHGIYDAMNRGLARSRGSYVWFLNGGDETSVKRWRDLEELMSKDSSCMVLGAYWLDLGSRRVLRRPRTKAYLWHALPTSHQAILYPGNLARSTLYDTGYRVAGDYAFTAKMSQACGCVITNVPLATFRVGGTSHTHASVIATEAAFVQAHVLHRGWISRLASGGLHRASRWRRQLLARPVPDQESHG